MSPFLFILAAEGLGHYIKSPFQLGHIKGLYLWGNDLPITHQQFVDEIKLFYQVSLHEVRKLKYILNEFMKSYRTMINNDKSNILLFNTCVPT